MYNIDAWYVCSYFVLPLYLKFPISLLIMQAIMLQTFFTLILRWKIRRTKFTILGIWICTGLVIGIPYAATHPRPYYGPQQVIVSPFSKEIPKKELNF